MGLAASGATVDGDIGVVRTSMDGRRQRPGGAFSQHVSTLPLPNN